MAEPRYKTTVVSYPLSASRTPPDPVPPLTGKWKLVGVSCCAGKLPLAEDNCDNYADFLAPSRGATVPVAFIFYVWQEETSP